MSFVFNPFTGNFDAVGSSSATSLYKGVLSSAPTGTEGAIYINSSNNTMYVYYTGGWQVMHVLNALTGPTTGVLSEAGDYLTTEAGEYLVQE